MTKHKFERKRNLFILLGTMLIGVGVAMPFRSTPGGAWGLALVILCTVGLLVGGLMQFRLAYVLHRRAQDTLE
jgi:amino acid permease